MRALIDTVPGERHRLLRRHRPLPVRAQAARRGAEVLARHRRRAARSAASSSLVVACNSAAAAALDALRERLTIPVIGVIEPGLRAAVRITSTGRIGVIGTVGTDRVGRVPTTGARVVAEPGVPIELTCAACPGFVEFVEAGDVDVRPGARARGAIARPRTGGRGRHAGPRMYALPVARPHDRRRDGHGTSCSSPAPTRRRWRSATCSTPTVPAPGAVPVTRRHIFMTSGRADTFRSLGSRFLGPEVVTVEAWSWT